jgi:hypothetical protein
MTLMQHVQTMSRSGWLGAGCVGVSVRHGEECSDFGYVAKRAGFDLWEEDECTFEHQSLFCPG